MSSAAEARFRPIAATIVDRLRAAPDRVAVEWGGGALTGAQLLGWASSIAADLVADGLRPGDRVAIDGGRTPGFAATMLAGLASGAVMVPLDPTLPLERRRHMVAASGADRLVRIGGSGDLAPATLTIPPMPDRAHADGLTVVERAPRDPAYVYFTSGSTGVPKGILGSQIGMSSTVIWLRDRMEIGPGDRVAFLRSVSFDASLRELLLPLASGGTLVIGPEPVDPDRAMRWLGEQRITVCTASPSHVGIWLDAVEEPVETTLRWTIFTGERLDSSIVRRFRELTTSPGTVVNSYGPTETTLTRTFGVVADDPPEPVPVGHPFDDSTMHVLRDDGSACAPGEPGEVVIATDAGSLQYLGDADQSPFIADPGGRHAMAYRTGDRGWLQEDGQLVVSGRFDDQVQILGVRLEPGEVSAALGTHPGIERAAVVAVPDPQTGHHFVAFVQLADGQAADEVGWRDHLLERVMRPAMPRRFVVVEGFPVNVNGKIDRAELRRRAEQLDTTGDVVPARAQASHAGPTDLAERARALSADQRALVLERLRARSEPQPTSGRTAPASFAQERLWFLDRLFPGRTNYNVPRIHRVRGPVDVDALRAAFDVVHARHEVLRTRFAEADGEPVQVIDPVGPAPFEVLDETGADDERIAELAASLSRRRFDLGTGPVWQATLVRLGADDHLLSVVIHHIASDGWSMPPLYTELSEVYQAQLERREPDLPPLPMQYAEYATRQRRRHDEGGFEPDLDHWAAELDGAPPLLTLPGTLSRPDRPTNRGARVRFRVPEVTADRLRELAATYSVTPFMIGLALFQGYLSQEAGVDDVVVGTASADRESGDIQGLIGFLVNSLPMRAVLEPTTSYEELLGQVRERAVRAYRHREVPFEHIVRRISPPRSTAHTPIFQVFYQFGTGEFSTPLELGEATAERITRRSETAKFDLALYLGSGSGVLGGSMVFSTDLFDAARMQQLVDGFADFCAGALADPQRPLREARSAAVHEPLPATAVVEPVPAVPAASSSSDVRADRIAALWSALFDMPVGVDDDFFALGGHSLMAIRMFSRLESELGFRAPIGAIFESPTPRGLAEQLDAGPPESDGVDAPIPIETAAAREPAERRGSLSHAQQRLWFLDKLTPGLGNYHIPHRMRLRGPLDLAALQRAVDAVVARHGILRTRIEDSDQGPVQVVPPHATVPLRLEDHSAADPEQRDELLRAALRREAREPFDLATGPLVRAAVLRVAPDEHIVSIVVHHIASDGESWPVLRRDLRTAYAAAVDGRTASLPRLPLEFVDVAARQVARFENEGDAGLLAWLDELAGSPTVLELPSDLARPQTQAAEAGVVNRRVDDDVRAALLEVARQEDATPFMVALAAFGLLVSRHTGERDLLIGTPLTERSDPAHEELVGFFVNTVPIRITIPERATFRELVRSVKRRVVFAIEHADVPLGAMIQALDVPRDPSRTPLFQVVFDLGRGGEPVPFHPTLEHLPLGVGGRTRAAKFDLRLFCGLGKDRLRTAFEYRKDVFERPAVIAMAEQYSALLAEVVAAPDADVDELSGLGERDRRVIEEDLSFDGTARAALLSRFRSMVREHPDAPAVVDGDTTISYTELAAEAAQIASRLGKVGIGPGHTVGLTMGRSAQLVAAMIGVLQVGAAYVPLDQSSPRSRTQAIAADAALAATISGDAGRLELSVHEVGPPRLDPEDEIAYVMYTSGSTGQPKGVVVPERAIWRLAVEPDYVSLGPGDIVAFASNTAFDAATFEVFGALLNGATLHVIDRDTLVAPARLAAELRRGGVTTMFVTTALFNAVIAERPDAFASVRELLFGGEAADVNAVRACLAGGAPTRLLNVYGPTETTTFATTHEITEVPAAAKTIPIGRPIGGTSVRVVDATGRQAPIGVPGELVIGGPGVTAGYLGDAEQTAQRFRRGPDGSIEYHTGDLVRRRADGALVFEGRLDRQIKIRGFRIEPGEIETHLTAHPAVREAVVVARPTDAGLRLAAFVVADPGFDQSEALRHLSGRIPAFMMPASVVTLAALPRTPNGKIDLAALPDGPADAQEHRPPTTPALVTMAGLWQEVLGVDRVGIDDDFFALGGHSIVAIRLMASVRETFGVHADLSLLFEAPTLAAFTDRIVGPTLPVDEATPAPSGLVVIRPGGSLTPVFCLPPAGGTVMVYEPMARAFDGERTVYGVQAVGVDGLTEPLRTIEAMAEHSERVIRAVRPEGPYLLAGYSMGGLVAFELARRLTEGGHQVDFVGLIDAQIPARISRRERLDRDMQIVKRHGADGVKAIGRRWRRSLRSMAGIVRHDPWAALTRARGRRLSPLQVGRRMTAAGWQASLDYEPLPYDGPVVYFRAAAGRTRAALRRWRSVTPGGLEIIDIAGRHKGIDSVMVDPYATVLAKEMRRIIERREQQ